MNKTLKVLILIFFSTGLLKAQPSANELLCIHTVNNETEMNAIINPYPGSLIFVISENTIYFRQTNQWKKIGDNWQIFGNNVNDNAFVGTIIEEDLKFRTSNQDRIVIKSNGNIGINTNSPNGIFEVNSKVENVDIIPTMTSNTSNMCTLSGSVSALGTSTTYKDAFDNNNSTNWFCSGTDDSNVDNNPDIWVVVDFGEPIQIQEYSLRSGSHSQRVPKEYRLQGSSDGVNWNDLETTNQVSPNNWTSVPIRTHTLTNNMSYRYYRLYFSASYESYTLGATAYANYQIDEIELKADILEFLVAQDGKVGINNIKPDETLHVNGNIFADAYLTPDYVFEHYFEANKSSKPDYQFKSLDQIYKFVKKNHHLPNIPSKKDIEKQGGIILNRAVEQQLEKIEELYLHLIELENYVSSLEKKYQQLK